MGRIVWLLPIEHIGFGGEACDVHETTGSFILVVEQGSGEFWALDTVVIKNVDGFLVRCYIIGDYA